MLKAGKKASEEIENYLKTISDYEHCMEIVDINDRVCRIDPGVEHYYCYNVAEEILDYIVIGSFGHVDIIDRL